MGSNNDIRLTSTQLYGIIISVIISTLFMSIIIYLVTTHLLSNDDRVIATISALGNISGGIIGGFVAFLVAKTQISSSLKNEKRISTNSVISHLKLLKSEFTYNKKLIEEFKEDIIGQINVDVIDQLSTEAWSSSSSKISTELSDDDLMSILTTATTTNLLKVHIKNNRTDNIETELDDLCSFLSETISLLDENIKKLI
ncbi:hypothetical protein CSV79_01805 [Sporosarcina sp. P13]|uniref:hypothetical protein n=1 Tax=Sporosarcina sp. P13 TaxID=2048263 RepID=UPI000C16BC39|nr:hypothetical protein [Sporosarcina sp. P13]PIC65380.1 hypothetical protein CSV79_01805 [Sporosarcina sp. P13]